MRPRTEDVTMTEPAVRFTARLGAAMAAANYPVTVVRDVLSRVAADFGLPDDFIVLPNHVQVIGPAAADGSIVKAASLDRDVRFDQAFALGRLVRDAVSGRVTVADGESRLDRLLGRPRPYRTWVNMLGYGIQSAGLALVLEPTPLNVLIAAVLGVMVGGFWAAGQRFTGLAPLLPVISSFAVTSICIIGANRLGLDHLGLRALIPPLAMFLPGVAITLAVIELTSRDVISGASRLIAGFIQIVQLAFGILIATQMLNMPENQLTAAAVNKIGWWAPWLGVLVYGIGVMLFLAPPRKFLPWLVVITYSAYLGQHVGGLVVGSYGSGFCGAFVLTVVALAAARYARDAPPVITMILPGFWLLVPGSMGLIGFTELFGMEDESALPATLISMTSVAFGLQAGLVFWRWAPRDGREAGQPSAGGR
jgi:uncharacterized membrane protein YjjP (DUF1212 family)